MINNIKLIISTHKLLLKLIFCAAFVNYKCIILNRLQLTDFKTYFSLYNLCMANNRIIIISIHKKIVKMSFVCYIKLKINNLRSWIDNGFQ